MNHKSPGPAAPAIAGWSLKATAARRLWGIGIHLVRGLWLARTAYLERPEGERDQVVRDWSARMLQIMGVELVMQGQAASGAKLVVSNHVSWLDIVAINAVVPSRFVSKAEVATWPLVGAMVSAAGTLYLQRERRRDAVRVIGLMSDALREGHTVAVFPEGTTSDGRALLHFHANMLQAAIDAQVPIQPLALRYRDAVHPISPAAAYAGDTTLWQSLWSIVTAPGLTVHLQILAPRAAWGADRRTLAASLCEQIEHGLACK